MLLYYCNQYNRESVMQMPKTFQELCAENNISPSITRKSIFNYLKNVERKQHPTVDDIYKNVKPDIPTLSKTTVYNILNLLIDHNLVRSIPLTKNEKQYELLLHNHSHFICKACHEIYDIPVIETSYDTDAYSNFHIDNEEVILRGICPSCMTQ